MPIRGTLQEVPFIAFVWYGEEFNKFEWKFTAPSENDSFGEKDKASKFIENGSMAATTKDEVNNMFSDLEISKNDVAGDSSSAEHLTMSIPNLTFIYLVLFVSLLMVIPL